MASPYRKDRALTTPRFEFTPRVILGSILVTIPFILFVVGMTFIALPTRGYQSARKTETLAWDAGPAPQVVVDLFTGSITVAQATGNRVEAKLTKLAVTKESQATADAALDAIAVAATQEGGTVRIRTTAAATLPLDQWRADLELRIPPGASIDLRTGHGYIYVGKVFADPYGGSLTDAPVTLRAVAARDEGETDIGIEVDLAARPGVPPTRLDLASRHGSVAVHGDNVLITARADGGAVQYAGRPAPGTHQIRTGPYVPHVHQPGQAVKGIRLTIPADCPVAIDAETQRAAITSDFPATATTTPQGKTLRSPPGTAGDVKLELRTVDGPIEIRQGAGKTSL